MINDSKACRRLLCPSARRPGLLPRLMASGNGGEWFDPEAFHFDVMIFLFLFYHH